MDYGVRPSKTSPQFLETNATSHTWIFSAVAELIDNAYDPDVKASQVYIDKDEINGYTCLTFTDDGAGMDEKQLHNMLSFGYSQKEEIGGHKPIGRYGNGFKSGSMRLGKDAIVLTRQAETMSVGLLSRTYLKSINADTVLVPIVSFSTKTKKLLNDKSPSKNQDLDAILKYSIYRRLDDLVNNLSSVANGAKSGTKIIIYNLTVHSDSNGDLELIFDKDAKDIINRSCSLEESDHRRSLHKYCSILYLKPRMKIYIMGKKVAQRLIAKDLCKTETDSYSPKWSDEKIKITFGFHPKSRGDPTKTEYGMMIYHKNRLIQAYEKIGYQKQPNELGVGVVGVIEVDYLTPIHNKQNFNTDHRYTTLMFSLGVKLNQYWDTKMNVSSSQNGIVVDEDLQPDCNWVMCDNCNQWRRLPPGQNADNDDTWYCENNPDKRFNRCDIPQEALEEGELDLPNKTSSYQKQKKRKSITARRSSVGDASIQRELEAERAKNKKRIEAEKANRAKRHRAWENVDRNVRELARQTQALMAELNPSVDDVVDKVHHIGADSERALQCLKCQCWRIVPEDYHTNAVDVWDCSMHPNPVIRHLCRDMSTPTTSADERPAKRVKVEFEEVDLTQDDDVLYFKSEDDEEEEVAHSKENNDLNAMQSQVYDLNVKLDVLRRVAVKVKAEKVHSAVQTDISMAYSSLALLNDVASTSIADDQSDSTTSSSHSAEEELRQIRIYAQRFLKWLLPHVDIKDSSQALQYMKDVCDVNRIQI